MRDVLEFGSPDVISFVSILLAKGVAKVAAQRAIRSCVPVHGGSDFSHESNCCHHRRSRRQAKVSPRRRALLTLRVRCRRLREACCGFRSVRVGEVLHPGPSARVLRRGARSEAGVTMMANSQRVGITRQHSSHGIGPSARHRD